MDIVKNFVIRESMNCSTKIWLEFCGRRFDLWFSGQSIDDQSNKMESHTLEISPNEKGTCELHAIFMNKNNEGEITNTILNLYDKSSGVKTPVLNYNSFDIKQDDTAYFIAECNVRFSCN